MRETKTTPGTWEHTEANAHAELRRRAEKVVETPHYPIMHACITNGQLTPWRDSWQEVLSDFRVLNPAPETLVLIP